MMENFSTGLQNYRHVYLVHSTDGGETWNSETACDVTPDVDFDGFENVFPCVPQRILNGSLNVTFQRDYEPGLHVRGDEDPLDLNEIIGLTLAVEDLDDCADVDFEDFVGIGELTEVSFGLYPNPASSNVEVVLDERLADGQVRLFDPSGRMVLTQRFNERLVRLDVSNLAPGLYTVAVTGAGARSIKRLAVN